MMLELTLENMGKFVAKRREGVREPGKSKGDQMSLWRKRVAVAPSSGCGSCSCQSRWGFCRTKPYLDTEKTRLREEGNS